MREIKIACFACLVTGLFTCSVAFGQGGRGIYAADPNNATRSYDKHDISGIWSRNGSPGGYGGGGTCRDCRDRGFGNYVPPFTAVGQNMFDANKPSYGLNLGSADAAAHPEEHIGRRRAVPPANGTDPYQTCNPMGPSRALIYPDPMEMNVLADKILQQFEWGNGVRTIWTDGRPLPKDVDLPRWWVTPLQNGMAILSWCKPPVSTKEPGWTTTGIRIAPTWCLRNATGESLMTFSN